MRAEERQRGLLTLVGKVIPLAAPPRRLALVAATGFPADEHPVILARLGGELPWPFRSITAGRTPTSAWSVAIVAVLPVAVAVRFPDAARNSRSAFAPTVDAPLDNRAKNHRLLIEYLHPTREKSGADDLASTPATALVDSSKELAVFQQELLAAPSSILSLFDGRPPLVDQ